MSAHAVRVDDVFYLYRAPQGDVAALRGLTLDVGERETVAVLGPSGSGKSTLLRLCAGFTRPSSGSLLVLDRPFDDADAAEAARVRRQAIGIVRQHYHLALPRELPADEIVALPLRLAGASSREARRRASDVLRRAGLARRAGAFPDELSGGEQQRVAVCAALAKRPRLLLADEPTGELDAASSAAVVELLLDLADEVGAAALVVTHDEAVAHALARTIHIRDGRLAAEGAASPVLVVDEQGWLRLPRRLREQAGLGDHVRARATWGRVELVPEGAVVRTVTPQPEMHLDPAEKRLTEAAVEQLSKRHPGAEAATIDALTWTFAPEQLHVIAGPSGSGKTTLLNLLGSLDRPDSGQVWVGGERIDALTADDAADWRRRTVGIVSQHSTLVDFLSARENVELGLALRGFDPREQRRRALHWLEWVGLERLAERRADRLSGGEQRRVALARALAPTPRVVLADEPTAHLDRLNGRIVTNLLREAAHATGITVIAATHDRDLIAAADSRLLLAGVSASG